MRIRAASRRARTRSRNGVLGAVTFVLAATLAACGGGSGEDTTATTTTSPTADATGAAQGPEDGPTITVGSFNFPESVILAEIYAQALESAGYPVEKQLDLGARELIFPSLQSGEIDLLPEYVGSALAVGFGVEDVPTDTDAAVEMLQQQFQESGVEVLEPSPAQDKNVFVVTREFAEEHDLQTISDLANVEGEVILGGPPECQDRSTCYAGLQQTYGLDELQFRTIQESSARFAALENGDIQVALAFSTLPIIEQNDLVALEEDQAFIPPENVVPVISQEVAEAYGQEFRELLNTVSAAIETETLIELNTQVEVETQDPAAVARAFLEENGLLQSAGG